MSKFILLDDNYYYLESKYVKMFPSAYRGFDEDKLQFDPEARLNTEYNFTHLGDANYKNGNYIISWNDSLLKCVLNGYYFELNIEPTDLKISNALTLQYAYTQLENVLIRDATEWDVQRNTQKLKSLYSSVTSLDFIIGEARQVSVFTGIRFANTGDGLQIAKISGANIIPAYENFIPTQVKSGEYQNSILIGSELHAGKYGQIVLGSVTPDTTDSESRVVIADQGKNILTARKEKIALDADTIIVNGDILTNNTNKIAKNLDINLQNNREINIYKIFDEEEQVKLLQIKNDSTEIKNDVTISGEAIVNSLLAKENAEIVKMLTLSKPVTDQETTVLKNADESFKVTNKGNLTAKNINADNVVANDISANNIEVSGQFHGQLYGSIYGNGQTITTNKLAQHLQKNWYQHNIWLTTATNVNSDWYYCYNCFSFLNADKYSYTSKSSDQESAKAFYRFLEGFSNYFGIYSSSNDVAATNVCPVSGEWAYSTSGGKTSKNHVVKLYTTYATVSLTTTYTLHCTYLADDTEKKDQLLIKVLKITDPVTKTDTYTIDETAYTFDLIDNTVNLKTSIE